MKHKNPANIYAFLMIEYEMPNFIKELQNKISDEELYVTDDKDDYGIEKEPHVTLVPCLNNDVDLEEIKKYLKNIEEYNIVLTDISKFECDEYDVLKCAVKSKALSDTNKEIKDNFETHSDYDEYKPHMTIAYMKHGMADKYLKNILPKLLFLKPKNFIFSYNDSNGKSKKKKF